MSSPPKPKDDTEVKREHLINTGGYALTKITIPPVSGGFELKNTVDARFQQIEDELNTKVLYKTNPVGEDNSLDNDIDMDGYDLLNTGTVNADTILVDGTDYEAVLQALVAQAAAIVANDDGIQTQFSGVSEAIIAVVSEPTSYPVDSSVTTISYRTKAECDALNITFPDDGGSDYVIKALGSPDGYGDHAAGTKQLTLRATESVSIDKFGAVGNFNPSTGDGEDDRLPIQSLVNFAMLKGGLEITATPGKHYYLGTGYSAGGNIGAQISIGDQAVANSANNIVLKTAGAVFYQGAAGRAFMFTNANHCEWDSPYIVGYTGGVLGASRENDACMMINKKCFNIEIYGHYLTNSLGDCLILQAAVDEADGGLGNESRSINIHDGIIKERAGDGIASFLGGTKSREGIAVIVGIGVRIHNNTIYGSVDLEPNLSDQVIVNCKISNNHFSNGKVVPQDVIGTDYWHDELITTSGLGALINNDIKLQGVAGAPIISGCSVSDNTIDNGEVRCSRMYEFDVIADNNFTDGAIAIGSDDGLGSTKNISITGNNANGVVAGRNGFIELLGATADCLISNNTLTLAGDCVFIGVPSVGPDFDQGNAFVNNKAPIGNDITGKILNASITLSNRPLANTRYEEMLVISGFTGASVTLDFGLNQASSWYIQNSVSGEHTSLSNISNSLGDGHVIKLMAEADGAGSLTIIHSGSMKLKGGINAVLSNTNQITFERNFGRWVEISRNF